MRNKDLLWRNFPGGTEINAEERATSIRFVFGQQRSFSCPPQSLCSCQEPVAVQPGDTDLGLHPDPAGGASPSGSSALPFCSTTSNSTTYQRCKAGSRGVPITALCSDPVPWLIRQQLPRDEFLFLHLALKRHMFPQQPPVERCFVLSYFVVLGRK